jgi:iron complex transport system substrate-binding protein
VATALGDVTIPRPPTRVVALGWADAETALALGVQPVGAADWIKFGGSGVGPWATSLYEKPPTILATTEVNYEAIAALKPDVILNTASDASDKTHKLLSGIAPTVAIPPGVGAWGTPWDKQVAIVAKALGREAKGKQLIDDLNAKFASARSANPTFAGKKVAVAPFFSGQYGAYVNIDTRVRFMEQLGFVNKPEIQALATGSFYIPVSKERLDLLNADLTVVFPFVMSDAATIRNDPLLQAVPSVKAGRMVLLDDQAVNQSFSTGSVLSLAYAIDKAVPMFAAALK